MGVSRASGLTSAFPRKNDNLRLPLAFVEDYYPDQTFELVFESAELLLVTASHCCCSDLQLEVSHSALYLSFALDTVNLTPSSNAAQIPSDFDFHPSEHFQISHRAINSMKTFSILGNRFIAYSELCAGACFKRADIVKQTSFKK